MHHRCALGRANVDVPSWIFHVDAERTNRLAQTSHSKSANSHKLGFYLTEGVFWILTGREAVGPRRPLGRRCGLDAVNSDVGRPPIRMPEAMRYSQISQRRNLHRPIIVRLAQKLAARSLLAASSRDRTPDLVRSAGDVDVVNAERSEGIHHRIVNGRCRTDRT